MTFKSFARTAASSALALAAMAGVAFADGYGSGSAKDAPADEGRKLTWSITLGATSDYIFRGLSLNDEKPAAQGSIDIGYGIFYAGVWGSNLTSEALGPGEVDVYAGIKPVLGPITFDFGAIGYFYPGEDYDGPGQAEYVEFKAGASMTPFKDGSVAVAAYYSPQTQLTSDDETLAIEGTLGYTFRQVGIFVPTLSGTFGWQYIEDTSFSDDLNDDDYLYWNVGVALAVDKFTIDLRYWDTDISEGAIYTDPKLADERFVASVKVTLP